MRPLRCFCRCSKLGMGIYSRGFGTEGRSSPFFSVSFPRLILPSPPPDPPPPHEKGDMGEAKGWIVLFHRSCSPALAAVSHFGAAQGVATMTDENRFSYYTKIMQSRWIAAAAAVRKPSSAFSVRLDTG